MATIEVKTPEEYKAELAVHGAKLINPILYPRHKSPMPPCSDLLLAGVSDDPDMKEFYDQYFSNHPHNIFTDAELDSFTCTPIVGDSLVSNGIMGCLPSGCTTLYGLRGSANYIDTPATKISRLFVGDLVWLHWMDRMGLFEMQAKLVNDYAIEGRYPIEIESDPLIPNSNKLILIILEIMVRQFQAGTTSLVRDRVSTYRRCLGWTTLTGRKMDLHTEVNTAFNSQFHLFIRTALRYYQDRRLATAIQQTVGGGSSASTRVAVAEALKLLKEAFVVFNYGRNRYNTVNGIVNAVATLNLIRTVRDDLGVPSGFTKPSQYVSAAYALLIEGKSPSAYKPNRYLLHKDCAEKARDLLNDIEVLDVDSVDEVGKWVENTYIEEFVETYRKAYRDLTNIDLAESTQTIEQQV